jgi:hypothetical protein
LWAVRALNPDVTIVHVQRADAEGNAHCWGNFGVMLEGVRAAKRVILVTEEIVEPEVIASDPNRTVIPGFLVNAVVEVLMVRTPRQCRAITAATMTFSANTTNKPQLWQTVMGGCGSGFTGLRTAKLIAQN